MATKAPADGPAFLRRHVAGILWSLLAPDLAAGRPRLPSQSEVGMAFGVARNHAYEKAWLTRDGRLTAAGRREDARRREDPLDPDKARGYRVLLVAARAGRLAAKGAALDAALDALDEVDPG